MLNYFSKRMWTWIKKTPSSALLIPSQPINEIDFEHQCLKWVHEKEWDKLKGWVNDHPDFYLKIDPSSWWQMAMKNPSDMLEYLRAGLPLNPTSDQKNAYHELVDVPFPVGTLETERIGVWKKLLEVLRSQGLDINAPNAQGENAFLYALSKKKVNLCHLMLSEGALEEMKNPAGGPSLYWMDVYLKAHGGSSQGIERLEHSIKEMQKKRWIQQALENQRALIWSHVAPLNAFENHSKSHKKL